MARGGAAGDDKAAGGAKPRRVGLVKSVSGVLAVPSKLQKAVSAHLPLINAASALRNTHSTATVVDKVHLIQSTTVRRCTLTPSDPQLKGAWYPGGFNPRTYKVRNPVSKRAFQTCNVRRYGTARSKTSTAPRGGALHVESS